MPKRNRASKAITRRSRQPRGPLALVGLWKDVGDDKIDRFVRDVYASTGHAYSVGLTGPPGVGKSTLSSQLVRLARAEQQPVGVIFNEQPVAYIAAGAVNRNLLAGESAEDDHRNQFFGKLIGSVIV